MGCVPALQNVRAQRLKRRSLRQRNQQRSGLERAENPRSSQRPKRISCHQELLLEVGVVDCRDCGHQRGISLGQGLRSDVCCWVVTGELHQPRIKIGIARVERAGGQPINGVVCALAPILRDGRARRASD